MLKTKVASILIILSFNCLAQHYVGIEYGAVLNQNLNQNLDFESTQLRSNYSILYKTYLSKKIALDIGIGMYKHDIQSHYMAHDTPTVQDYTMHINLFTEYLRIPLNFNILLTNPQKKFGMVFIIGCKFGYLLNKSIVTESYDVIESNFTTNTLKEYTVSNSQSINISNNKNVERFDWGYQIGVAFEINKILHGGIRFYSGYNSSFQEQFKSGALEIKNGDKLCNNKSKWINANFTYFFRISEQTSYIKLNRKKTSDNKIRAVY